MRIDDIAPPIEAAMQAAQDGTPLTLTVDADVFAADWHREHTPEHPAVGCALCEPHPPLPVSVPTKRCCGVLLGEVCDCAEFAAQARGVFARGAIMCRPASRWGA
jgi:hypothetical protein